MKPDQKALYIYTYIYVCKYFHGGWSYRTMYKHIIHLKKVLRSHQQNIAPGHAMNTVPSCIIILFLFETILSCYKISFGGPLRAQPLFDTTQPMKHLASEFIREGNFCDKGRGRKQFQKLDLMKVLSVKFNMCHRVIAHRW